MRKQNRFGYVVPVCVALVAAAAWYWRGDLRDAYVELSKPRVPAAQYRPIANATGSNAVNPALLPDDVNWTVPFMSQAPSRVWDQIHNEFCEEAAVLMVQAYITGNDEIAHVGPAEKRLREVRGWEMTTFGYFEDTTAAQTARILREFLGVSTTKIIENPTEATLKTYLAQGKIVIVPVYGRRLGNPHFRSPGPVYHMIVLKGYTKDDKFIVNDPGTKYGADYVYPIETVMDAMHDYNGGDVLNGDKVVIVAG